MGLFVENSDPDPPGTTRIASSAKHVLRVPTGATRAKRIAWDRETQEWVDVVHHGD